jgi:hypothetical protein
VLTDQAELAQPGTPDINGTSGSSGITETAALEY